MSDFRQALEGIKINEERLFEEWAGKAFTDLFDELVPGSGPAPTVEGELIRALNKVIYRWYNDGDYFYKGYGIETAGAPYKFLVAYALQLKIPGLADVLKNAISKREEEYRKALAEAEKIIVDYVKSKAGQYTPNHDDMYNTDYAQRAERQFGSPDAEFEDESVSEAKSTSAERMVAFKKAFDSDKVGKWIYTWLSGRNPKDSKGDAPAKGSEHKLVWGETDVKFIGPFAKVDAEVTEDGYYMKFYDCANPNEQTVPFRQVEKAAGMFAATIWEVAIRGVIV